MSESVDKAVDAVVSNIRAAGFFEEWQTRQKHAEKALKSQAMPEDQFKSSAAFFALGFAMACVEVVKRDELIREAFLKAVARVDSPAPVSGSELH